MAKKLKKSPKDKYYCSVKFEGQMKVQFQIRAILKSKIKRAKKVWSKHYKDRILIFGEIKPIELKT